MKIVHVVDRERSRSRARVEHLVPELHVVILADVAGRSVVDLDPGGPPERHHFGGSESAPVRVRDKGDAARRVDRVDRRLTGRGLAVEVARHAEPEDVPRDPARAGRVQLDAAVDADLAVGEARHVVGAAVVGQKQHVVPAAFVRKGDLLRCEEPVGNGGVSVQIGLPDFEIFPIEIHQCISFMLFQVRWTGSINRSPARSPPRCRTPSRKAAAGKTSRAETRLRG